MFEKFKTQMQVGSWLVVAALGLSALWLVQSIDQMRHSGTATNTVTVAGMGKIMAKPDIAVADLAITIDGTTADAAQNEANKKSAAVVAYLKGAGIEEKDIRTSSYNIYPQYDYVNGRSRIRGYQVTQSLTVKIRDLDDANDILDGVVGAGVNQVNNFRFDIDDPEQLRKEAREEAIADARKKANDLKSELGVRLGSIVSFSESANGFPDYYKFAVDGRGGMGGAPENPVPALPTGENEIVVNVSITYEIR